MTHLRFVQRPIPLDRKTPIFEIYSNEKEDAVLGTIAWYAHWRRYVLESSHNIVWSDDCLEEVSQFIKQLMAEKKMKTNFPDVPIEELSNRQISSLYKVLKEKTIEEGHTLPQSHSRWCGACESFMHVKRLIESRLRTKQMQRFKW